MGSKEQNAARKAAGICMVCCGRSVVTGKASCQRCMDKAKANAHKYTHLNKERRDRLIASGLCEKCGKTRDDASKLSCVSCRIKYSDKSNKYNHSPEVRLYRDESGEHHYLTNVEKVALMGKVRATKLKETVMNFYGGECACCGVDDLPFLQIDHINGGGNQHRRDLGMHNGGGLNMYRWLRDNNFPDGFQVLCTSCNFAKRDGKCCPHKELWSNPNQMSLFVWSAINA